MLCHLYLYLYCIAETDFHIFVRGGWWINIWEGRVLLLSLTGAWWQRPEMPRKMFNKTCFLGLHTPPPQENPCLLHHKAVRK
jgi:hypothetical protein